MSRLTPAQKRFVDEYLVDLNAEAAAIRAGYSARGARRAACRNMQHAGVKQGIQVGKERRAERMQVTQDMVLRELAAIGFTTMADVCRWSGDTLELLDSGMLSPEQAAAIAEISETTTTRGGTVRVKLHSKLKALEMLARHVGLYDDKSDGIVPESISGKAVLSPELREKLDAMLGGRHGAPTGLMGASRRHNAVATSGAADGDDCGNEDGLDEYGESESDY